MSHGQELDETLALAARFGQEDAVPRLAELAGSGPIELRAAALRALPLIPTGSALKVALSSFKDPDPVLRAAAAGALGALGAMPMPRALDALLQRLPAETSPVADAIVLALGTSRSDRAFPVITNVLDTGTGGLQRAAVDALVEFGGSNAVAALTQRINSNHLALRYWIVLALAEKLHEPLRVEWLAPVLAGREQTHEWLDSLRLLRMYAAVRAIPALLSYLDFDVAWSGRNWWILREVQACPNAPRFTYEYDPNIDGTPDQWEKNRRTLQTLKAMAGPVAQVPLRPGQFPIPYLQTAPPIDFTPSFELLGPDGGGIRIKSGFLTMSQWRTAGEVPYSIPEPWRPVYERAARLRALPNDQSCCAELGISAEQLTQIGDLLRQFAVKLCGARVSDQRIGNFYTLLTLQSGYCPGDDDWTALLRAWKEAPRGPLQEQAKADLIESVRVFSQAYHGGTVAIVEAAKAVLSADQLERLWH